jgi:hypothetical protein
MNKLLILLTTFQFMREHEKTEIEYLTLYWWLHSKWKPVTQVIYSLRLDAWLSTSNIYMKL